MEPKISINELTIKEMKKIVHEIVEEEAKNYKLDIDVFPTTRLEYYKHQINNKKFDLAYIIPYVAPFIASGAYQILTKELFIFLNNIKICSLEIGDYYETIFTLAQTTYHEVRHLIQNKYDIYSYEGFLDALESYVMSNSINFNYLLCHDKYSFEIGANLYGTFKAKEYLKSKYPEQYQMQKEKIKELEKRHIFNYLTYDVSNTIEKFIEIFNIVERYILLHKEDNEIKKEIINPNEKSLYQVINIFINEENNFKKINEIINNKDFNKLDPKIVHAFFSCKSFLNSLDINSLTLKELEILSTSLQYTNIVYQNQNKVIENYFNDKLIDRKKQLQEQINLSTKPLDINKTLLKPLNKLLFLKNSTKRKERIKNIDRYLEHANKLIKQKKL